MDLAINETNKSKLIWTKKKSPQDQIKLYHRRIDTDTIPNIWYTQQSILCHWFDYLFDAFLFFVFDLLTQASEAKTMPGTTHEK